MGQVRFSAPENEVDAEEVAFVSLATQRSPPTRPLSSEVEELSASTENVQSFQVVRSSQVSQTSSRSNYFWWSAGEYFGYKIDCDNYRWT